MLICLLPVPRQGASSTLDELTASAFLTVELDRSLESHAVQVHLMSTQRFMYIGEQFAFIGVCEDKDVPVGLFMLVFITIGKSSAQGSYHCPCLQACILPSFDSHIRANFLSRWA